MALLNRPKLIILAFIIVIFLSWLFMGENCGMKYISIHQKLNSLNGEMAALNQENENLRQEIDSLKNDMSYLEAVAREKYGFLKENEMVFDFSKPAKK